MAATAKARDAHGVCTIVVTCWPRVLTKLVWNEATLMRSIALRAFQSRSSPLVLLAKCNFWRVIVTSPGPSTTHRGWASRAARRRLVELPTAAPTRLPMTNAGLPKATTSLCW